MKTHDDMDDAGITALVFQAMAIESYANLMGAYLTNESEFYKKYERAPIDKKLSGIIERLGYSISEDLISRIKKLFNRRNDLVHQKPKSFFLNIDPNKSDAFFEQKEALLSECSVSFSHVEESMCLYSELKEALKIARGSNLELYDEIFFNNEGET